MPSPQPSSRALPLVPDVDVAILFLFAPTGRPVLACHLQSLRSSVRTEMDESTKAWWFGRGWDHTHTHTHPCTTLNTLFAPSLPLARASRNAIFKQAPVHSPLHSQCPARLTGLPPTPTHTTHLPIHCPQSQRGLQNQNAYNSIDRHSAHMHKGPPIDQPCSRGRHCATNTSRGGHHEHAAR
jgi:hypothetical protein